RRGDAFCRTRGARHPCRRVSPRRAGAIDNPRSALARCRRPRRHAASRAGPDHLQAVLRKDRRPFGKCRRARNRPHPPHRPPTHHAAGDKRRAGPTRYLTKSSIRPNLALMTKPTDRERRVAAVRRFNRFYPRQSGGLRKTFLDSPYSLAEARVLYEIASGGAPTASAIGRALDLDAGYLSRVLRDFEKSGFIPRRVSARGAQARTL